jgi:signal transduction histidine kinase
MAISSHNHEGVYMNNWKTLIATILLLSAIVLVNQSALAGDKSIGFANASLNASHNLTELVKFVESAVAYAKEGGKEQALKEFNNKTGSFVNGELYIFAIDLNGTGLASLPKPDWIGKDSLNAKDPNGVLFNKNEIEALKRDPENGFFNYLIFPNPAHNNKNELKLAYLKKASDNWFVGSGIYLSNISASFDRKERDDLVTHVNEALKFARENGKQNSLEVFNDPKGNFTRDGRYIFAAEYGGKCLAQPFQPELIGKNRLDEKDPNGVKISRLASDVARQGNGFYYAIYPDPSRNMTPALKLNYATDVDGIWWLGSGIYAKGEETS